VDTIRTDDLGALRAGLEGVVVAETTLSDVDGERGRLTIGGYPVEELAPNATFEQTAFLLWNGRLPRHLEETDLREGLAARRTLDPLVASLVHEAAKTGGPVIDSVRMAVATLRTTTDDLQDAGAVVAAIPTVVAAHHRISHGSEPVPPREDLGHTANYSYMLRGVEPTEAEVQALQTYLNTVVDHGLNASTFVARAIASTGSDLVSCLAGAVGALKGPLHGGAPGPALDMVIEIGSLDRAESHLRNLLARGERLMGFGHRVYRVRDPRADVLAAAAERLYASGVDRSLYDLATGVEAIALRLLEEHKPGRSLRTNVEFYTALLLHGLGLPSSLFTPTFAVARSVGWAAHVLEQRRQNRVVRPQSRYVGERDLVWPR
jgi:citrate synthase